MTAAAPPLPTYPVNHAKTATITSMDGSLILPEDGIDGDFTTYLRWTGLMPGSVMQIELSEVNYVGAVLFVLKDADS